MAALYCFYNFREPWPHPTTVPDAQFGCAVAPAHHVLQKLKAASANFSHVAPLQVPWRTLVCRGEGRGRGRAASQSRGEKALDFIRGQIAELVGEEEAPEIVPSAEVPDYARAVMTNEGEFWQAQVPARRVVTTDFGGAAVRG